MLIKGTVARQQKNIWNRNAGQYDRFMWNVKMEVQ